MKWTLLVTVSPPAVTSYELDLPSQLDSKEIHPWVKICPFCLEPWAILARPPRRHHLHAVCCESCWQPNLYNPVPGSLLDDTTQYFINFALLHHLPLDLLQREFHLHTKAALNEHSQL